jgi:probable F420-dependent oxidoreductase
MDFGFNLPTRGPLANRESMLALAKRGEELGYTYLALPDHIVIPRAIGSLYPYSASRKMGAVGDGDCLETLTVMSFLAAATSKMRLLSSVLVVPHRPAVFTAKALATLDVLSQGRVIVGIGAGWMEEEFRAIGAPPFSERGKVTDEYLRAFKTLWTDDNPRFQGKYVQFDNVSFLPKPVQKPHPPIWVGGESPAALRRTAELGDAWYPIGSNPEFPLNTAERFSQGIARLHDAARKAGRDPASIRLTYWASWYKEGQTLNVDNGQRQVFTGSDDDVVRDIKDFGALGVKDLLFTFARPTLGESLAAMERFSDKVLARV